MTSFSETYLAETAEIARRLDAAAVERLARALSAIRDGGGRLFVLGVAGPPRTRRTPPRTSEAVQAGRMRRRTTSPS